MSAHVLLSNIRLELFTSIKKKNHDICISVEMLNGMPGFRLVSYHVNRNEMRIHNHIEIHFLLFFVVAFCYNFPCVIFGWDDRNFESTYWRFGSIWIRPTIYPYSFRYVSFIISVFLFFFFFLLLRCCHFF